jgi:hypothetical protein
MRVVDMVDDVAILGTIKDVTMTDTVARSKPAAKPAGRSELLRAVVRRMQDFTALDRLSDEQFSRRVADSFGHLEPAQLAEALEALSSIVSRVIREITVPQLKNHKRQKQLRIAQVSASTQLMQAAIGQARTAREKLVETEEVLPSGDITTALGVSRQALSKAVRANRLFALELGGERYYPAFFADPHLERRQLEAVSHILGDLAGWEKWQFFTTPKGSLGGVSPLDALKKGKYAEVRRAAEGFAKR